MVYSKAKLKSNGGKASPCFRPLSIRKLPDKYLPIRTLLQASFKHILININWFIGTPNSTRTLYNASLMREKRNAYRILVGKPEGKRSLGKPRRRCVDNNKIDLRDIG
jgi:hypothetical protein